MGIFYDLKACAFLNTSKKGKGCTLHMNLKMPRDVFLLLDSGRQLLDFDRSGDLFVLDYTQFGLLIVVEDGL